MTCEEQLAQSEEINNRLGQTIMRIKLHCALMNDRIEKMDPKDPAIPLVRELMKNVLIEIGP